MKQVLVVDGDRGMRNSLKERLEYEGYRLETAETREEALLKCEQTDFDLVLCDVTPGGLDPIVFLKTVRASKPQTSFIMLTAMKNCEMAVRAIKGGACDIVSKPIDLNRLLTTIRSLFGAESESHAKGENDEEKISNGEPAKAKPGGRKKSLDDVVQIIGDSSGIARVKSMIEKVAPSEARVLIMGDNGTGKELVAHWLHQKSARAEGPFIEVNCAAIPSELIESELFGHEKGAFTSAIKQRKGKFEQADGGTLFLDEIGDMSLSAQAKVLRALQENKITRVGSDKDITVNVRVIAATNKNLYDQIRGHNFREDLFHRLSVIVIRVPSLKERIEDVPVLVDYFIEKICQEYRIDSKPIERRAVEEMQRMEWSGNIRELHNVVERLVILCGKTITYDDVMTYAMKIA